MNFGKMRGNYGRSLPPMDGPRGPPFFDDDDDMDFQPFDDYNNGNRFMGRGGWNGGPPRGRGGRGGFNNFDVRPPPPPPIFGNFNNNPQFAWGRGFGPNGPPIQRNNGDCPPIRYLLRCGVPRENLKNLPRSFLQLIEPMHCGVCNMNFDSFTMSRAHYMSRNHNKNQKKWLIEAPADVGFRHLKNEAPMKSRDLYCELCDVQITSKVHAESHYIGKPHRAIVEGRKQPKNVALQKKNMAARVEQLIRRERKALKPLLAAAQNTEEEEAKPIQPDLFCQICKTSVTCSEQMTMHLNGKRHLSKEKQHILKMMKGDRSAQDKQEENAEEGTEEEISKDNPEGQAGEGEGEGEDKYDWGNGSAAWEENEEQPAAN